MIVLCCVSSRFWSLHWTLSFCLIKVITLYFNLYHDHNRYVQKVIWTLLVLFYPIIYLVRLVDQLCLRSKYRDYGTFEYLVYTWTIYHGDLIISTLFWMMVDDSYGSPELLCTHQLELMSVFFYPRQYYFNPGGEILMDTAQETQLIAHSGKC